MRFGTIVLLGLSLLVVPAMAQDVFFRHASGVPVAPGLLEDLASGLRFDTPEGRIVDAAASGTGQWAQITLYYKETLPALGWSLVSAGARELSFARENETLILQLVGQEGRKIRLGLAIKPSK